MTDERAGGTSAQAKPMSVQQNVGSRGEDKELMCGVQMNIVNWLYRIIRIIDEASISGGVMNV